MGEFATLRAANEARQREWAQDNQITLAYRGNEIAGETGEACNIIKKLERERLGIRGSRATNEQLGEELADIVICADLIAMDCGINLDAAVEAKFNATSEKYGLNTRLSHASLLSRIAELEEGLREAEEAVDAALGMVEKPGFIPNWDWLREVRKRARALLTKPEGETG